MRIAIKRGNRAKQFTRTFKATALLSDYPADTTELYELNLRVQAGLADTSTVHTMS